MVRNWTFEHFMNEVIKDNQQAEDIVHECQMAVHNYGLALHLIRKESGKLADRIFAALEKTTARLLAEDEEAFPAVGEDREGRRLILGEVARLSEVLEHVKDVAKQAGQ
jgi:hypothetical protein